MPPFAPHAAGIRLRPLVLTPALSSCLARVPPRRKPNRKRAPKPVVLNDASQLNPMPVAQAHAIVRAERRRRHPRRAAHAAEGCRRRRTGRSRWAARGIPWAGRACRATASRSRWSRLVRARRWQRRPIACAPAHAGATSSRTLDPLGFSPAVMQSNSDFSVGGTLSRQRAWLAGAVRAVRHHGALVPPDARRRLARHLLAHRERRSCSAS